MSLLFDPDDIRKIVAAAVQSNTLVGDEQIDRITKEIVKALSYDGENVHIPSNPESIVRDAVFIANNFYFDS